MMRFGARSSKRKPWEELFFSADGQTALDIKKQAITVMP
jgi:hypothetical protein